MQTKNKIHEGKYSAEHKNKPNINNIYSLESIGIKKKQGKTECIYL